MQLFEKDKYILYFDNDENLIIELSGDNISLKHFGFNKEQTKEFIDFITTHKKGSYLELHEFFNI